MKKLIAIVLALALLVTFAAPVMANDPPITTDVTMSSGGGTDPVVKCKWEQDTTADLEDGDPLHVHDPGSWFLAPGVKCTTKTIEYYAVVTDAEDMGNVDQVYVDVFHPADSPPPYSTSSDPRGAYFKYEIPMVNLGNLFVTANHDLLVAADDFDLVIYGDGFDLAELDAEKDTISLWHGEAEIDYEQPAGDYTVDCYAIDQNGNRSAVLSNTFLYVPLALLEVDFDSFTYGSVSLGVRKMVVGDLTWSPGGLVGFDQTEKATIRNVGNTWASPKITQDDMGFGKDYTGAWNVSFDARMGNDDLYKRNYDPDVAKTLPNYLDLSTKEELDLSIKVIKGTSGEKYTGTIVFESVDRDFVTPLPDELFGYADPCNGGA